MHCHCREWSGDCPLLRGSRCIVELINSLEVYAWFLTFKGIDMSEWINNNFIHDPHISIM